MSIPIFDTELPLEDNDACETAAKQILQKIKSDWDPSQIKFKVFTVGITNKIFAAFLSPDDRVIFRVFGKNTEKVIDREHELDCWSKLAERDLAAPLYAKFSNGLVCGYIQGEDLSVDNVGDLVIKREICRSMATMHNIPTPPSVTPQTFTKMRSFLANFSKRFSCPNKQARFDAHFQQDLQEQLNELESLVQQTNEEVVFCHNDLLVHNILFDKEKAKISFIDYEYADWNYAMFDICNHFEEYAGVDEPDYSRCPSSTEKKKFIDDYLTMRHGSLDSKRSAIMCQRTSLFEALSHFFWAVWALVQSQNSLIDFDYLGYGIARHEQYGLRLRQYEQINKI